MIHFPSTEALARTLMDEQFQLSEGLPAIDEPGLQTAIDLTHRMAFGLRSDVRIRAGIRLVIEFGSFTGIPGIVPADRISRFGPAGSPECRSELGLPAPDSAPPTTG
ncbi:hypothetical protein [Streptomyces sp. NPDC051546]|uniref:hypothetical protein n=1 Tax=Streptomyces sp. NPDC051546 TaxID=3365655 RepID=UPI0037A2331D